ncbi:MAG: histidine phosphatase family protein [Methylocystaceae bacterium]|nr:histidine phosphatase family protein [Methylocystaceae bacterium]
MTVEVTNFWWVRHAPVKAMMPGRIYGQRDVGCNLKDSERLKQIADQLPTEAIWVTSSLSRTKKTAKAIAEQGGYPIRPLAYKELMEQNFGLWQSKTWDDLEEDTEAAAFWTDPATTCPPDGESFRTLCQRVEKCVTHLIKKYPGQEIICVAHAGTIRAAIAQALNLSPANALRLKIDTLSISRLQHFSEVSRPDNWAVHGINF